MFFTIFYSSKSFRCSSVYGPNGAFGWICFQAKLFIALLYTTAPAVSSFARLNLVDTIHQTPYEWKERLGGSLPPWFSNWEKTGLVAWQDKNSDGHFTVWGR